MLRAVPAHGDETLTATPSSSGSGPSRALVWLLLAAVTCYGAWIRGQGLTAPWERGHRGTLGGGYFATFCTSYDRYGYAGTRLAPCLPMGDDSPPLQYFHHPPLLPLAVSLARGVLGEREVAYRALPYASSVAAIPLAFLLARAVAGPVAALGTAFAVAVVPMAASYGHFVSYEPLVLLFALLSALGCLQWWRERRRGALLLGVACLFLATLVDWPGYFIAPLLATVALGGGASAHPRRESLALLCLGPAALLVFVIYGALAEGSLRSFLGDFNDFAFVVAERGTRVSLLDWAGAHADFFRTFFRPELLAASLAGTLLFLRDLRRPERRLGSALALSFWIPALLNILLFWNNAYGHNFHTYYFTLPVALGCGRLLAAVWGAGRSAALAAACRVAVVLFLGWTTWDCAIACRDERLRVATDEYERIGRLMARHAAPGTLFVASKKVVQATFYSGVSPYLYWADVRVPADFAGVAEYVRVFHLTVERLLYVVTDSGLPTAQTLVAMATGRIAQEGDLSVYELPLDLLKRKSSGEVPALPGSE